MRLRNRNMISKLIGYFRSLFRIFTLRKWKPFWLDSGMLLTLEHGELEVGERVHLWPDVKISVVGTKEQPALVRFGKRAAMGNRSQIHACRLVHIGDHVRISWDVTILENNYHSNSKGPIHIDDYAWIGCRAIILGGVTIGRGAVVGAGSVVTKDVPPHTMVAGNPARPVRQVTPEYRVQNGMIILPN
jgi:acetyltransferase-like isoleucine patch superfamily enzyme